MKDLKYKVFCYIRDHGNRAPRALVESKFNLPSDYLDKLSGVLNDSLELQLDDGDVVLGPEGTEFVDRVFREKRLPFISAGFGVVLGAAITYIIEHWPF